MAYMLSTHIQGSNLTVSVMAGNESIVVPYRIANAGHIQVPYLGRYEIEDNDTGEKGSSVAQQLDGFAEWPHGHDLASVLPKCIYTEMLDMLNIMQKQVSELAQEEASAELLMMEYRIDDLAKLVSNLS